MATKVIMPKQGLQMTEGLITRWIVPEGGKVEANEPLFEMETDKLSIEITSPACGTLLKIIRGVGDVVPITETIAVIGEEGENFSELLGETPGNKQSNEPKEDRIFITPRAKMKAQEREIDFSNVKGTGPEGLIIERDVNSYENTTKRITPVAAKMAKEYNINLTNVTSTGTSRRILKEDIENLTAHRHSTVVQLAGIRKVISNRMMESLQNMAQANHRMRVDMTEAIRLREQLKLENIKISYNDIFVKVVSKALIDYPYMNSSMVEDGILLKDYVNMGMAVSVENGLIVPNIKDSDLLSLQQIAKASSVLIEKAQKGKLTPEEYANGTFTITNLGMYDIDEFTAIINPPESGILALGKIEKTSIVQGESVVIKPMLTMSLTYDHRIIDGALAAQFLQRVKQIIKNPYLLL
jgi:pyruvate dehydrogenase E2 component (dihydrolipoamide acetyltransferase)